MLSRRTKPILGAIGAVIFLAVAIGGFGAWKWHRLSHPRAGDLRAWDAAPASTVYLYYVPSVPAFYSRFFKYHQSSLASPTLATANRLGQSNSILHRQPSQSIRPEVDELMGASGSVMLFEYFAAMLPPTGGSRDLPVLLGGKCLNAPFASWILRRALGKNGFSWTRTVANGMTFHAGSRNGEQVFLGGVGDWLFLSHEMAAVAEAVRTVRQQGRESLGANASFQECRDATLRDSLIWVYADVRNCVASAAASGIPEAAEVIVRQLPYLKAAAYSFRCEGPYGRAVDLMGYTIDARGVAAAAKGLPKIDPGVFRSVPEGALSVMTGSVNFAELARWPLLESKEINRLANSAPGSPAPTRQFYRVITKQGQRRAVKWGEVNETATGELREWVSAAGELPGAPSPFLEIRFNYAEIAASLIEELKADWPSWKRAGEKAGLPMPEKAPSFEVGEYFNTTRVTAGFEGNTLCIYHSLRLGKSGSTGFTALNELNAFFFEQEMNRRIEQLRQPFAFAGGAHTPQWANPLDIAYVSGLFMSPFFTNHNGGTAAITILMLDTLAGGTLNAEEHNR